MICPHCNAILKENSKFCPHCGSDYNTGWSESAEFSNLELPDYDEIVENEFGKQKNKQHKPFAIIITLITIATFVIATFLF